MTATVTKVTVPTVVLRDLVSRAVKCSTFVDQVPMSSLMQVKVQDGKLFVKTTDNINYLTTYAEVNADNFEMIVQSKIFSQIISKVNSVDTSFILDGNQVIIEANGRYDVPLITDTDGSAIEFPSVSVEAVGTTRHLKSEEIKSVLTLSKSCKAEKTEVPAILGNYYADANAVLTTNYYKACSNPIALSDTPLLVSSFIMDLVPNVVDESGVDVYQDDSFVVFESTKGQLIGKKLSEAAVAEYPAEALSNLIKNPLASSVQMNRTLFIQAVDRMCLFVDAYEENRLNLTFSEEGLKLASTKTKSSETIKYTAPATVASPVTFSVNGCFLKAELTACDREDLVVRFSETVGLQIICGTTTLMLGILADEEQV